MLIVNKADFLEKMVFVKRSHFFFNSDLKCCSYRAVFNYCCGGKFQAIGPLYANEVLPMLKLYCGTAKSFLLHSKYS